MVQKNRKLKPNNMKPKYINLPAYVMHRGTELNPISGHLSEHPQLIAAAKAKKLKYQTILIGNDCRKWLFVQPEGVSRKDLEAQNLKNIYEYFTAILDSVINGQRKQAQELAAKLSTEQKKAALLWISQEADPTPEAKQTQEILINSF